MWDVGGESRRGNKIYCFVYDKSMRLYTVECVWPQILSSITCHAESSKY